MKSDKYYFFWNGPFSNWYPAKFEMFGNSFHNSEQALMYYKAITFKDEYMANKILGSANPREVKSFGRSVTGYNDKIWSDLRLEIMILILYHKFTQNVELLEIISENKHLRFVEASPYDIVWGIGLAEDDPKCLDENLWEGQNLLGNALSIVAAKL